MESIGNILKITREELNLTIDQVAIDTNIAKHHLLALEGETFSELPGETYLLGFLRNYADYLGLNPDEIISLYKNLKIQEAPPPVDLLHKKKEPPKTLLPVIIVLLSLLLVSTVIFYIYPRYIKSYVDNASSNQKVEQKKEEKQTLPDQLNVKTSYEFKDEVLEKRFKENEAISVVYKEKNYPLVISEISDVVTFLYPQGTLKMQSNTEELLDLDGDGTADIRVLLRSFDAEQSSLILHIDRFVQGERVKNTKNNETAQLSPNSNKNADTLAISEGSSIVTDKAKILKQAVTPEPFTLNVVFKGYCFFRYETDSRERKEKNYKKGEVIRLNVNSSVTLWSSNAGAFTAKIGGVDLDFGNSGEISTRIVKWNYSEAERQYQLLLIPAN